MMLLESESAVINHCMGDELACVGKPVCLRAKGNMSHLNSVCISKSAEKSEVTITDNQQTLTPACTE